MSTESTTDQVPGEQDAQHARLPLRRPASGRMIAGVAAGIARYASVDVMVVRIALLALGLLGIIGSSLSVAGIPLSLAGIPLYLACWLLMPEEGRAESIAGHLLAAARSRFR